MEKRKYTLRYGKSTDSDMVATFATGDTVFENLERIVPSAQAKGIIPPQCSADSLAILYEGKKLNVQLPLEEQVAGIQEYDLLVVRDLKMVVNVRVRYKADHVTEKSETVEVNPNEPTEKQLQPLIASLRKEHRFRGLRRKRFRLYDGKRKLNLRKSLIAQGIEEGFDARLVPWTVVGWPFKAFEITVISILLMSGIGLFSYWAYQKWKPRPPITQFQVVFQSDVDCQVLCEDTTMVSLTANRRTLVPMKPGKHELTIMPREHPIYDVTMNLVAEGAPSDTVIHAIATKEYWAGRTETMDLKVYGFFERVGGSSNRIQSPMLINRVPYQGDKVGVLSLEKLPRGTYEIQCDFDDDLLIEKKIEYPNVVLRRKPLWFDFSHYDGKDPARIVLVYHRPPTD